MQRLTRLLFGESSARERVVHEPACTCPDCGAAMRRIGEDVSEIISAIFWNLAAGVPQMRSTISGV